MQAVKDKITDMKVMRKAKAEAKAEEQAEKELAKARVDVAREVRLAREAEAEMDLHVAKAGDRAMKEVAKYEQNDSTATIAATAGIPTAAAANAPRSGPPNNYTTSYN